MDKNESEVNGVVAAWDVLESVLRESLMGLMDLDETRAMNAMAVAMVAFIELSAAVKKSSAGVANSEVCEGMMDLDDRCAMASMARVVERGVCEVCGARMMLDEVEGGLLCSRWAEHYGVDLSKNGEGVDLPLSSVDEVELQRLLRGLNLLQREKVEETLASNSEILEKLSLTNGHVVKLQEVINRREDEGSARWDALRKEVGDSLAAAEVAAQISNSEIYVGMEAAYKSILVMMELIVSPVSAGSAENGGLE